jgi:hypothetical protein
MRAMPRKFFVPLITAGFFGCPVRIEWYACRIGALILYVPGGKYKIMTFFVEEAQCGSALQGSLWFIARMIASRSSSRPFPTAPNFLTFRRT